MKQTVLIIGAAGQDGVLLSRHCRRAGQRVVGLTRSGVIENGVHITSPISLTDSFGLKSMLREVSPDRVYYLAAHHHSSEQRPTGNLPEELGSLFAQSVDINLNGWLLVLALLDEHLPECRAFYASSSLVFGRGRDEPFTERAAFEPVTPYAITKAAATEAAVYYRRHRSRHISAGILFNHESIRRTRTYVSRKIVQAATEAALGRPAPLNLRNADALVDWTAAEDVVGAMHLAVEHALPDTYVIGSGIARSVRDLVAESYRALDVDGPNLPAPRAQMAPPMISDPARIRGIGWSLRYPWPSWVHRMARAERWLQVSNAAFGQRPGGLP